jgi:hypothetical protein
LFKPVAERPGIFCSCKTIQDSLQLLPPNSHGKSKTGFWSLNILKYDLGTNRMKKLMKRELGAVLAGFALAVTLAIRTNAADIHVPDDYGTIQEAVDASVTGDSVYVAPGVYQEQIRIVRKSISLIGEPGTIIRAFPDMEPIYEEEGIVR